MELSNRIVEWASECVDVSPCLDNLRRLEEDPLDISQATAEELQQIPGVSAQAAFRIVSFRDGHPIERIEDLRTIQGIDPELIAALEPYISFHGNTSHIPFHPTVAIRTRVVRRFSQDPSAEESSYLGPPEKVYNRISARFSLSPESHSSKSGADRLSGSSVSFGLLTSKDPGEKNYADLVRGQLMVNVPGYLTRLVLGDYLVDGGQGLVFWRPLGFSKGGETTSGVSKNGAGVWPSLSTGQSATFRGIGLNIQPRGIGLHLFYSNKLLDATADSEGTITHLSTDDLHRTDTELEKKDRLREKTLGARLTFDFGKGLKLGMSGFSSHFAQPVRLPGPYGFHGDQTSAIGVDGLYTSASVSAFMEIAQDRSRALSAVAGFSANLRSDLTAAFLLRSYSRSYNNFHSSGFSESGDGSKNESGIYSGLTFHPAPWLGIAAFVDQFTFPWCTSGSLMASQGHEYYFRVDLRIRENLGIELQIRQKDKDEANASFDITEKNWVNSDCAGRNAYRATLRFEPTGSIRWNNYVEIVTVGPENESVQESGMLFFQDLTAGFGSALSVSARVVAFHTASFNSRAYEYRR